MTCIARRYALPPLHIPKTEHYSMVALAITMTINIEQILSKYSSVKTDQFSFFSKPHNNVLDVVLNRRNLHLPLPNLLNMF